jgi:hypothetical protein
MTDSNETVGSDEYDTVDPDDPCSPLVPPETVDEYDTVDPDDPHAPVVPPQIIEADSPRADLADTAESDEPTDPYATWEDEDE